VFFDNANYFSFVERARARGVRVPIIPASCPSPTWRRSKRFTAMCGAHIPAPLKARLEAVREDEEAVRMIGIDHATAQCRELLAHGAPGIHFYTLNQSPATRRSLNVYAGDPWPASSLSPRCSLPLGPGEGGGRLLSHRCEDVTSHQNQQRLPLGSVQGIMYLDALCCTAARTSCGSKRPWLNL